MYERNLKDELFACFKYVGIPLDVLERMPIRDRHYYMHKYNEYVEQRNEILDSGSMTGDDIERFTDMSQGI